MFKINKCRKISSTTIHKGFIFIGILSILYYLGLNIIFGKIAFSFVFFILGLFFVAYGGLEVKYNLNLWIKIPKCIRSGITIVIIIGLTIFTLIEGLIFYEGHHYDTKKPDYVMVLGAGLRGNEISKSLLYRLKTAIEFNKMYPDVNIIVSGGKGSGENITEAEAMRNYLINNGVDERLIIMEDKSTSTYENFKFTKNLLKDITGKEDYTITVITNNFHMYRAKFLGEEVGFECLGYPAPAHVSTSFNFHVREFFGVVRAYVFKR